MISKIALLHRCVSKLMKRYIQNNNIALDMFVLKLYDIARTIVVAMVTVMWPLICIGVGIMIL